MTTDQIREALRLASPAELASALASHRENKRGGPKVTYVTCPKCNAQVTKTQARRGHGCQRKSMLSETAK